MMSNSQSQSVHREQVAASLLQCGQQQALQLPYYPLPKSLYNPLPPFILSPMPMRISMQDVPTSTILSGHNPAMVATVTNSSSGNNTAQNLVSSAHLPQPAVPFTGKSIDATIQAVVQSVGPTSNLDTAGSPRLQCPQCPKKYKHRHGLSQHIHQCHEQHEAFVCVECGKSFPRKYQLQRHSRVHSNGQSGDATYATYTEYGDESYSTHSCDSCSAVYESKAELIRHKHQCHSSHAANQQRSLVVHEEVSGNGKYPCATCGKRFTNSYGLRRHERCHTGERPFVCDVCGLGFMERSHVLQHHLTHTGETPYNCHICNRAFNRKFSYERHVRWHSKGFGSTTTSLETPRTVQKEPGKNAVFPIQGQMNLPEVPMITGGVAAAFLHASPSLSLAIPAEVAAAAAGMRDAFNSSMNATVALSTNFLPASTK